MLVACLCWLAPASGFAWSEDQEIAKGQDTYESILSRSQAYGNAGLQDYIRQVGQRIAEISDRPNLEYTFTIIDEAAVNAYAAPGGFVFIDRGLLAYLNTEDQLAAVLAHEIAHVTAKHAERRSRASNTRKAFSGIASVATYLYTGSAELADLPSYLGEAWIKGYGRKMELEADAIGTRYLVRAGYKKEAMLEVIGILKQQDIFQRRLSKGQRPPSYHGIFSTHPSNDQRLQKVVFSARKQPVVVDEVDPIGDYLKMIDGLSFGQTTGDGFDQDNNYYSASLDVQLKFPKGWQASQRNGGLLSHPITGPQDAYVLVRIYPLAQPLTKEQRLPYVEQTLNITPISQISAVSVGDLTGIKALVHSGQTQQQKQQRQVVALFSEKKAYVFLGALTEQSLADEWQQAFDSIVNSVQPLGENTASLALARVQLQLTGEGDSYESLLPELAQADSKTIENRVLLFKLLNGDYPRGSLGPGERIKVVR